MSAPRGGRRVFFHQTAMLVLKWLRGAGRGWPRCRTGLAWGGRSRAAPGRARLTCEPCNSPPAMVGVGAPRGSSLKPIRSNRPVDAYALHFPRRRSAAGSPGLIPNLVRPGSLGRALRWARPSYCGAARTCRAPPAHRASGRPRSWRAAACSVAHQSAGLIEGTIVAKVGRGVILPFVEGRFD
jgi:hypothetical protein